MSYQHGEIYFIREREAVGFSPYVKIGLVRYAEGRDSFNRLSEHQTGNPRHLFLDQRLIIQTQAVDMVEAQMHRQFATKRVNGEWFEFSAEVELEEAINEARKLAIDVSTRVMVLTTAEELAKQVSTGRILTASAEIHEKAKALALAKEKSRRCSVLLALIKEKMAFAFTAGTDVSGVAKTTTRTFKPKLDTDALAAAHPTIYSQFEVPTLKFRGTFLLKLKGAELVIEDALFMREVEELEHTINAVTEHRDIERLNEPNLALTQLKGLADWDVEVLQAEIQVALGTAEAFEGVCTWKRSESITNVFDAASFAEAYPELAKQFMVVAEPKTYVAPTKKKAK